MFLEKIKNMKILLGDYMYKNKLTTRQVAMITGVPKTTIQRIASNRTCPRLDTLEKIAKGLQVPFWTLYESEI